MLTSAQQEIARRFLAMPEAEGFALAGGAALIMQRVVDRDTGDLDLFVHDQAAVRAALDAFVVMADAAGWGVDILRTGPSFARLLVTIGSETVAMDLGYDHRWMPPDELDVGPVLTVRELGVDKLLALLGRAEARDFVDVYHLAAVLGIEAMVDSASRKDAGFDPYHLAINLDSIERHRRDAFQVDDDVLARMRDFFVALRASLIDRALRDPGEPA